jgi:hypothetical protein
VTTVELPAYRLAVRRGELLLEAGPNLSDPWHRLPPDALTRDGLKITLADAATLVYHGEATRAVLTTDPERYGAVVSADFKR